MALTWEQFLKNHAEDMERLGVVQPRFIREEDAMWAAAEASEEPVGVIAGRVRRRGGCY